MERHNNIIQYKESKYNLIELTAGPGLVQLSIRRNNILNMYLRVRGNKLKIMCQGFQNILPRIWQDATRVASPASDPVRADVTRVASPASDPVRGDYSRPGSTCQLSNTHTCIGYLCNIRYAVCIGYLCILGMGHVLGIYVY